MAENPSREPKGLLKSLFAGRDSVVRRSVRFLRRGWQARAAIWWRPRLNSTNIIAVTGSGSKSTTCAILTDILAETAPTIRGQGFNTKEAIAVNLLKVRKRHAYYVQESSGHQPGAIDAAVQLLHPHTAIVTTIGTDHLSNFRSKEAIAAEKGKLVEQLAPGGIAILNADDPLVIAMAARTSARVVTFGRAESADIRLLGLEGDFPDRMSLTIAEGDAMTEIRTNMVGERWAVPTLAAIACARALGVDMDICKRSVEAYLPLFDRDSVHAVPGGPTFVMDSDKAPFWSLESSFTTVRKARAPRRTIVIGTISDYPGAAGQRYRSVARQAMEAADRVIFVGANSHLVDKVLAANQGRLLSFPTVRAASDFLASGTMPNELIYVKASGQADHIERLLFHMQEPIGCWEHQCGRISRCHECRHLRRQRPVPAEEKRPI